MARTAISAAATVSGNAPEAATSQTDPARPRDLPLFKVDSSCEIVHGAFEEVHRPIFDATLLHIWGRSGDGSAEETSKGEDGGDYLLLEGRFREWASSGTDVHFILEVRGCLED
jgi:hypothetical protein